MDVFGRGFVLEDLEDLLDLGGGEVAVVVEVEGGEDVLEEGLLRLFVGHGGGVESLEVPEGKRLLLVREQFQFSPSYSLCLTCSPQACRAVPRSGASPG